jgi:cytochrome c-type biogenesis protein CcmE
MKIGKRFLIGGVIIAAALTYLIYGGMQEAIVYFVTPSELKAQDRSSKDRLRLGGMVLQGSLEKDLKNLTYRFKITDGVESIPIYFKGVPPDLFSEDSEEYSPPEEGEHPSSRSFVPGQKDKGT